MDLYIANGYASRYLQGSGQHIWYNATNNVSGAGASLSFTQAMTLTAAGRLGVGQTSPGVAFSVAGQSEAWQIACTTASGTSGALIGSPAADVLAFGTWAGTERARIDSSGTFYVGGGTTQSTTSLTLISGGYVRVNKYNGVSGDEFIPFSRNGTTIGSITQNGTTAVAYNTSSDYRLKHDIAPMTGALAKVAALKPVTYKWNADNSDGEGFIAHELAEVCPHAVTGEKDATRIEQYEISPAVPATFDEDGNELTPAVEAVMGEREVPAYQGIDTSFLVATLTAAIKEQQAIIETLTARITALEAK